MMLNRRQFVAGCAAVMGPLLAGCSDGSDVVIDEDIGEVLQDISLTMRKPTIDYITVSGEVVNGFAERAPATINVEVTNESRDERQFSGAHFSGFHSSNLSAQRDSGTTHLIAVPVSYKNQIPIWDPDNPDQLLDFPDVPVNGCWQLPGSTFLDPDYPAGPTEPFWLASGDGFVEQFELYLPHTATGVTEEEPTCPPPGRYPFWTHISVDGAALIWGFDIHVSQ